MNQQRRDEIKAICDRAAPAPLHVERVDHDDSITYEVSSPKDLGFHVVFSEVDYRDEDEKLVRNPKHDAEFYAAARSALPEALAYIEELEETARIILRMADRILTVTNAVTAPHRYGDPIPGEALDRVANRQTEFEFEVQEAKKLLEGVPG